MDKYSNSLKKAVVVYKKSRLDYVKEHGSEPEKTHLSSLILAHECHERSILLVTDALLACNVPYETVYRADLSKDVLKNALVITVGGDGTLLDASHYCLDSPIIGVNSAPQSSVGALCLTDAPGFLPILKQILSGQLRPSLISRLEVKIENQIQFPLALNDILFCHKNPAAMARFTVSVDGVTEYHRSSGLWVATATGSTGGILSCGAMPISEQDRAIFHMREPYFCDAEIPQLLKGTLTSSQKLYITSDMGDGQIFIDGHHKVIDIDFGQSIEISLSNEHLRLFDGPSIKKKRDEIIKYRQMIRKLL